MKRRCMGKLWATSLIGHQLLNERELLSVNRHLSLNPGVTG